MKCRTQMYAKPGEEEAAEGGPGWEMRKGERTLDGRRWWDGGWIIRVDERLMPQCSRASGGRKVKHVKVEGSMERRRPETEPGKNV